MDLDARGRGVFTATATADEGGATVRLDDSRRPDFWAEVRLTRQQLVELLRDVDAADLSRKLEAYTYADVAGTQFVMPRD